MNRPLITLLACAVALPALAQDAPADWDLVRDPAKKSVLAFTVFDVGLSVAFRCVDGSLNTVEGMSVDVAAFLLWAAEPKMNARKAAGLTGVIFLGVLSVLLYLTNKRIWEPIKNPKGQPAIGQSPTGTRQGGQRGA